MSEDVNIAIAFGVMGAFIWYSISLFKRRELRWKTLAREFSVLNASTLATGTKKNWTEDADLFEWALEGLHISVSGGSKALMTPYTQMPVLVAGGEVCVKFSPPLPNALSIRRGASALTGDPQFDASIAAAADEFWIRALKEDYDLRHRTLALVNSMNRIVLISQDALVLKCFSPDEFLQIAKDGLELAKLLEAQGRSTPG